MIERFHRPLKAALMAANKQRWTEALPVALLGPPIVSQPDIGCHTGGARLWLNSQAAGRILQPFV